MNTTILEQDGKMVAVLEGSLDTAAAPQSEETMSPLNNVEGKDIILDCTSLEYISSAGLRIFLGILQHADTEDAQNDTRQEGGKARYGIEQDVAHEGRHGEERQ